jgi:hypothetical protein
VEFKTHPRCAAPLSGIGIDAALVVPGRRRPIRHGHKRYNTRREVRGAEHAWQGVRRRAGRAGGDGRRGRGGSSRIPRWAREAKARNEKDPAHLSAGPVREETRARGTGLRCKSCKRHARSIKNARRLQPGDGWHRALGRAGVGDVARPKPLYQIRNRPDGIARQHPQGARRQGQPWLYRKTPAPRLATHGATEARPRRVWCCEGDDFRAPKTFGADYNNR